MTRAFAVFLVCLIGGCLGTAVNERDPAAAPPPWNFECSSATTQMLDGTCVRTLHALTQGDGRQGESEVATHPTDPATLMVTWQTIPAGYAVQIRVAVTSDGGGTWKTSQLAYDPAGLKGVLPLLTYRSDPVAAIAPDGTLYVAFMGDTHRPGGVPPVAFWITVAQSSDSGHTWTYSQLGREAGSADYEDIAVAPDTGDVYVVTNTVSSRVGRGVSEILLYRSQTRGATWGPAMVVSPASEGTYTFPRVAAGPGGLVVVGAQREPSGQRGAGVAISTDGGITFQPWRDVTSGPSGTMNPIVSTIEDEVVIDVVAQAGDAIQVYRSRDLGKSFQETTLWIPRADAPPPAVFAAGRGGLTASFVLWGHTPSRHAGTIATWNGSAVHEVPIFQAVGVDGEWRSGDDYHGIDVAADGSVWASWSDRRFPPSIQVVHLVARG